MATGSLHGVLSLVEMMLSYGTGSDQASLSPKAVVAADEFVDSLSNQFEMVCRLKDGDKLATTDCEGETVPCCRVLRALPVNVCAASVCLVPCFDVLLVAIRREETLCAPVFVDALFLHPRLSVPGCLSAIFDELSSGVSADNGGKRVKSRGSNEHAVVNVGFKTVRPSPHPLCTGGVALFCVRGSHVRLETPA